MVKIQHLGHHNVGTTSRAAYQRKLAEAERTAYELNNSPTVPDYVSWGGSA